MRRSCVVLAVLPVALACHDVPLTNRVAGPPLSADAIAPTGAVVSRVDLGTLGGRSSYATDVNNSGTVVGWSEDAGGVNRAFRWTAADGMADLGTLPGDAWSTAIRIIDDGRILGFSGASGTFVGTSVVWSPSGAVTALSIPLLPNAERGGVSDFNQRGQFVGWDLFALQHAWFWSEARGKYDITANVPGGFEGSAGGINAGGLVVGTNHAGVCTRSPECWHAFLWSCESGYRDLGIPGVDPNTNVVGIGLNDAATVVGWVSVPGLGLYPYRWSDSQGFTPLPSASYGYAEAINSRGTAVGASWDPVYGAIQAAAWPAVGGIVKLSPDDPYPQVALAINDAGVVAGWSSKDCCGGENHATVWSLGAAVTALPAVIAWNTQPVGGSTPPTVSAPASGAVACLTDARALVSREALFQCVSRRE
jgi:probable HAF family extracellular repeat protein